MIRGIYEEGSPELKREQRLYTYVLQMQVAHSNAMNAETVAERVSWDKEFWMAVNSISALEMGKGLAKP